MSVSPLPLEEAQARLLALAEPLPTERVDVWNSLGRYLSAPVNAVRTQPAADLSAMDGYAVLSGDMAGPWRVTGESAAGHPYRGEVQAGEAVRIATGALMPSGTDAVILQEDITRNGDAIVLTGAPPEPPGRHIRRRGMDFIDGAEVLSTGARIGPAQAALAISSGHVHVPVRRKPRIVIIDSGDELVANPADCQVHQIPASNGTMLAAMASSLPCQIEQMGPVPDDMEAFAAVLARAEMADIVVTSGGASVGDHDLVRPAIAAWGAESAFWRVAIKPGKPLLVATREGKAGKQIILGLPGNPVSSHVTAYLFLLPLIRALSGSAQPLPRHLVARAKEPVPANGSRRTFLRASWDGTAVSVRSVQDSSALASLAASNVLIDRPAGAPAAPAGQEVRVFLLDSGGIA